MSKLADVIGKMSQEELMNLKRELETGSIKTIVNSKIQEMQQDDMMNRICPVCHSSIGEESFTLTFGPKGLRKKASFCATDCLEYFLKTKLVPEEKNE